MVRRTLIAGLILALAAPLAMAERNRNKDKDLWLHVRVEESHDEGETVRINIPLDLVEALLPLVETDEFAGGKVRMLEWEVDEVDIHKVWEVLREAKDGEFVTIEGTDKNIRVAKQGKYMLVDVEEDGETQVDIKVPLSVVDALFAGGEDELDILAAVQALRKHGPGELVTVTDRESTVRVWVDDKNTSK